MRISVNTHVPLVRASEIDFVIPIYIDIMATGGFDEAEDDIPERVVGKIWAERLDWALAEEMGYQPLMICDAASATWLQVYETLTNKKGDALRRDLNLEYYYSQFLFVHEFLLHPELTDRIAVLDAAIREMAGENSLVLMFHEQGLAHHIEDADYRDLGFKKIARSSLLIRDSHFCYPFGDSHCGGREVEFTATAEHEEWLLDNWDSLLTDHPSL